MWQLNVFCPLYDYKCVYYHSVNIFIMEELGEAEGIGVRADPSSNFHRHQF